jgi:hypothetical protein
MVCDSCGSTSPEGSKFCIHCGAALGQPVEASSPPVEAEPERAEPEPEAPPVVARVHPPPVVAPPPPPPLEAPAPPPPVVPSPIPPPPPPIPAAMTPPAPPAAPVGMVPSPPPPPPPPEELAPPEPESPVGLVDPAELAAAVARLSANAQRAGRVAAAVLSALLHDGEHVDALVQGRYQGHAGVAVLTNERVLLVNDHEWHPDVREVPIVAELVVQGWQDDRTASLVFVSEGQSVTIEMITDRPLAQEMAHLIRARVGDLEG